jgi:hypothetical protein
VAARGARPSLWASALATDRPIFLGIYFTGSAAIPGGVINIGSGFAATMTLKVPSGTDGLLPPYACPSGVLIASACTKASNGVPFSRSGDLLDTTVTPLGCPPAATARGKFRVKSLLSDSGIGTGSSTSQPALLSATTSWNANAQLSDESARYQIWTCALGFPSSSLRKTSWFSDLGPANFRNCSRACVQLSRMVAAASCTPARKFLASLS